MTSGPLNLYGDKLIPTTGVHGSNIAEQRMDELDEASLDFVKSRIASGQPCQIIDIGGGTGAHSKRLAEAGAKVLLIDLTDQYQPIAAFNNKLGREAIHFHQGDVREIDKWPTPLHAVFSQRMLSCLPYAHTINLLTRLQQAALPDAQFFLSIGGLDTEYGADYADRNKPVEQRFSPFSPAMATKHGIYAPECLFRENELRQLVEKCGLIVSKSWTSPFGNPKLIAHPDPERVLSRR